MSRARILIYPSIREGWGLSITEAAAVGTPSIVFDKPGTVDAVNDGKAGYLCKTCNTRGISETMLQCVSDETEYQEMRKKAYQFSCIFWVGISWFLSQTTRDLPLTLSSPYPWKDSLYPLPHHF